MALVGLAFAVPAQAGPSRSCTPPPVGAEWTRATPAQLGLDAAKLQDALDFGAQSATKATTAVYRHGCLAGVDKDAAAARDDRFESWSAGKSVVSLAAGRAMTLGLLSPDDPLGSLVPEADRAHGRLTLRRLLEMAGGLHWNFYRDYSLVTPNRVNDGLTLGIDHPPGTYFEYSQSTVSLVTEMVERAVGGDFQAFVQRELFGPIGIKAGDWSWKRDGAGNTVGFMGLELRPRDYARIGQLMLGRGVWRGRRLVDEAYVRTATTPTKPNKGYGWFWWTNAGTSFVGPTTVRRQVFDHRLFESGPADMYSAIGLNDQLIMVFPKLDLVLTRSGGAGQGGGGPATPTGNAGFRHELIRRLMAAVTDARVPAAGPYVAKPPVPNEGPEYGIASSAAEPAQVAAATVTPPLPPRGPAVARAVVIGGSAVHVAPLRLAVDERGRVVVPLACAALGLKICSGTVTLGGKKVAFRLKRGAKGVVAVPASGARRATVRVASDAPAGATVSDAGAVLKAAS